MGSPYRLEPNFGLTTEIVLVSGVMGSGKTASLINAAEQLEEKEAKYFIIKPEIDTRTAEIWSRDGRTRPCIVIGTQQELIDAISSHEGYDTLLVDEAQFFNSEFIKQICMLSDLHKIGRVIFYSLKTDYMDNLFEAWKEIVKYANKMYGLQMFCEVCGKQHAVHNMRMSGGDSLFEVGTDNYKAVCTPCYHGERK